jgi:hypothetical protein
MDNKGKKKIKGTIPFIRTGLHLIRDVTYVFIDKKNILHVVEATNPIIKKILIDSNIYKHTDLNSFKEEYTKTEFEKIITPLVNSEDYTLGEAAAAFCGSLDILENGTPKDFFTGMYKTINGSISLDYLIIKPKDQLVKTI